MDDEEYAAFDALTRIHTFGGTCAAQFAAATDFARTIALHQPDRLPALRDLSPKDFLQVLKSLKP